MSCTCIRYTGQLVFSCCYYILNYRCSKLMAGKLQHRCWWGACYEIDLIQENILNHNIYILYVWYILWDHPKAGFASAWWKSKDHREAEHEENSLGFIWAAGDPSKLECDGEMKQLITGVRINSYQPQYIFEVEQTPGEISKRRVCFIPVCTYSSLPI